MASSKTILAKIFAEHYLTGSQARKDGKPLAWISAFTPVELLQAMDVVCMYPESYAVVCSASGKSQEMIQASKMAGFSQDLCSYSLLSLGAEHYPNLPYGGLPEPDFLVATNNQCGTTYLWFKLLAQKKNIPLFIIDYPASLDNDSISEYIKLQYESLKEFVKEQTANKLSEDKLSEYLDNSRRACKLWKDLHELNKGSSRGLETYKIIDSLFPIVVARGSKLACDYYEALIEENSDLDKTTDKSFRLLWHGYPMWFLAKKYPRSFDDELRIVLNNYSLWWNLDYGDSDDNISSMISAYSRTYLNWPIDKKLGWAIQMIDEYSIDCVVFHANRSCRRALAEIMPLKERLAEMNVPSIVLESDMANSSFYSKEQIALRVESFREMLRARGI